MQTIYLDVSCLNRPFDDQLQTRIRLEAEAVEIILEAIDAGLYRHASSEMVDIEIAANPDYERQRRITALLPDRSCRIGLTPAVFHRAEELEKLGFKPADALHVAAAEWLKADVLLSCDNRMCRVAARNRSRLTVRVVNPLDWLKESPYATDA